jgi:hypothetical protein
MNEVAAAIAVTWMVLAIVGRWKPERAWDDRLGRIVGIVWIVYFLGAPLLPLLP